MSVDVQSTQIPVTTSPGGISQATPPTPKPTLSKPWVTIALLVIFAPIGLGLMWHYGHFPKPVRIILSIILGIFILGQLSDISAAGAARREAQQAQAARSRSNEAAKATPTAATTAHVTSDSPATTPERYCSKDLDEIARAVKHLNKAGLYDETLVAQFAPRAAYVSEHTGRKLILVAKDLNKLRATLRFTPDMAADTMMNTFRTAKAKNVSFDSLMTGMTGIREGSDD